MTIVLLATPRSSSFFNSWPTFPSCSVMLRHAIGIEAEACYALRLRFQMRIDVHPSRVEPDEERLLRIMRAVDEIERGAEELFVHRLHALLRQWVRVLAFLLAPRPKARVVAGSLRVGGDAFHHAARAEAGLELGVLRIVRVLRLFF